MQYTTALVNTKKTALVGLVEMLQLVLMISIYRTKIIPSSYYQGFLLRLQPHQIGRASCRERVCLYV